MRIKKGERITVRFLNWMAGICTRVENIRGYNGIDVKNIGSGIYIGLATQESSTSVPIKYVYLTGTTATAGNMSGGTLGAGYYSAAIAMLPVGPIDVSGTFSDAGVDSPPTQCYAINPYEQSVGARFLDTTGTTVPVVFPVTLWGTSTAAYGSLPVYRMIGSIQGVPLCSTGGEVGGS